MRAKLVAPESDKSWSLQFFDVPRNRAFRANVWYQARHFGEHFKVAPFLQGDSEDWMMVEFWSKAESYILEACEQICKILDVELEI